jgi:AcrR family transcriptional regulator
MDEKTATRDRILQAAMARIRHYGFGKTTMAEIAADCEMSPGNIYRFFESKLDIAEAMARRASAEQTAFVSSIAQRKDIPVDQRLRRVFLERTRRTHGLLHNDPKSQEVADVLARERPLYYKEVFAAELVVLAALIEEGMEQGLFAPGDAVYTAEMLQVATVRFSTARMLSASDLPALERSLEGVLDLIFFGLIARPKPPA